MRIVKIKCLIILAFTLCRISADAAEASQLPKGLMLNLDLQNTVFGLIPSRSTPPLYVPADGLAIGNVNNRYVLEIRKGQGLDIPHSSLLDPDGSEWVISTRVFPLSDGIILSQGNDHYGYAIRIVDGIVQAALRTSHSSVILKEQSDTGLTKCHNQWISVELRIKPERAILLLNRKLAAMVELDAPFKGENMYIRLGNHQTLPRIFKNLPEWSSPDGFSGGLSSLKIFRQ